MNIIPIGDILGFLWVLFAFPKVLAWLIYKRREWRDEEDRLDIEAAREALAEAEREGFVSWEEFGKGLEAADGALIRKMSNKKE